MISLLVQLPNILILLASVRAVKLILEVTPRKQPVSMISLLAQLRNILILLVSAQIVKLTLEEAQISCHVSTIKVHVLQLNT